MSKSIAKLLIGITVFMICVIIVVPSCLIPSASGQTVNLVYLPVVLSPDGPTTLVSVNSTGTQANNHSALPSISADGRYVAFSSDADNLVEDDTNGVTDLFLHDRQTGLTTRISIASDGTQGDNVSSSPFISPDGRYVAFHSAASNLVTNDTNNKEDIFVHDRQTGKTSRVSIASDGTQANYNSFDASITADGRYVAFGSFANNLVSGDNLFYTADIFIYDRQKEETIRISTDGAEFDQYYGSVISANGHYITFYTSASDLVSDDTNGESDIFVYDLHTGENSRVSVASDGTQSNSSSHNPSISADGRYIAYESYASNLVANDTNDSTDIFAHDRQTGVTIRVSVASDGMQSGGELGFPVISANGGYVAFGARSDSLAPGDTNQSYDVFVHDIQRGLTTLVSQTPDGLSGNSDSYFPSISADGRYVAFQSYASNLIPNDTNLTVRDVFIRNLWMEP